jgi:hypothetical protein
VGTGVHLRRGFQEEHLIARLALIIGGAVAALAGSFMPWSHGLAGDSGPITEGRVGGDGKYTALVAVALVCCAAWYLARPGRRTAAVTLIAAVMLFLLSVVEWNSVSDRVESANRDNGLFATASVAPGSWIVMLGAIAALAGGIWTSRIDR